MAPEPDARPAPRRRVSRRLIVIVSAVALGTGLVVVGFGLGQLLLPRTVVAASDPEPDVAESRAEQIVVPDVLGLDEATARRVFTDAGVDATVTLSDRPSGGPVGLVVAQEPAAGGTWDSEPLTLVLSSEAAVPDVAGLSAADARFALERLGAVVTFSRVVDQTAAEGTVVSSSPAAGTTLGLIVDLAIADAGESITLGSLRSINSDGCSVQSRGSINGTSFDDSVSCEAGGDVSSREWVLGRHASVLESSLGILDSGEAGTATVRVLGDGVLLLSQEVPAGTSADIRVDLRGVLRLRIEVSGPSDDVDLVFGSAIIRAPEAELALIDGQG